LRKREEKEGFSVQAEKTGRGIVCRRPAATVKGVSVIVSGPEPRGNKEGTALAQETLQRNHAGKRPYPVYCLASPRTRGEDSPVKGHYLAGKGKEHFLGEKKSISFSRRGEEGYFLRVTGAGRLVHQRSRPRHQKNS